VSRKGSTRTVFISHRNDSGKMAVDEHRMAVLAVAGDVGNVVMAVDYAHALTNGLDRVEQNTILDVLGLVPDFPFALHRASPSEARGLR
jgi:hypothetical protein